LHESAAVELSGTSLAIISLVASFLQCAEDHTMFNEQSRAYVNHLMAEHRRLHRMLVIARAAMATDNPDWLAQFIRVLVDIRAELKCHFAEEEGGGCLDQAVSFLPSLSPEMRQIELEHPQLLATLDTLLAQAKDCRDTPADRVALRLAFEELCHALHAHEAAENDVLRKGFHVHMEDEGNGVAARPASA
jgi:hypothetical protein